MKIRWRDFEMGEFLGGNVLNSRALLYLRVSVPAWSFCCAGSTTRSLMLPVIVISSRTCFLVPGSWICGCLRGKTNLVCTHVSSYSFSVMGCVWWVLFRLVLVLLCSNCGVFHLSQSRCADFGSRTCSENGALLWATACSAQWLTLVCFCALQPG